MTVFDDALLERARPRSRAVIGTPTVIGRASNPLCGDDIEVSARVVDGVIIVAAYRSHACALTSASASLLADLLPGRPMASAQEIMDALAAALADRARAMPDGFDVLASARLLPSRHRCILLPWEALKAALAAADS